MAAKCEYHSGLEQKIDDVATDTSYIRGRVDELTAWMNTQKGVTEGRRPYISWIVGILSVLITSTISGIWGAKYAIAHALELATKGLSQ